MPEFLYGIDFRPLTTALPKASPPRFKVAWVPLSPHPKQPPTVPVNLINHRQKSLPLAPAPQNITTPCSGHWTRRAA